MKVIVSVVFMLIAGGLWYAGWRVDPSKGFPIAIVISAPLIALAALPLIASLSSRTLRLAKEIAYRDLEGRNYAYKGRSIRVHEDLAGDRWIRLDDVRKIVSRLPRDEVWPKIAPDDLGKVEAKKELLLRAQALDDYLARNQDDATVRFRNWLEREVIFPAKRAGALGLARTSVREHMPPAAPF